jgi:hypothetical protein
LIERPAAQGRAVRPKDSTSPLRAAQAERLAVLGCCAALSVAAIVWGWRNGALLNYGDARAHLHIARRVFDSRQPRFSELGSVWLPLPHILLLPFVQVYSWWANGLAGVFPSALAWLAACAGMYRLARHWLPAGAAAVALAFFALDPNLLYLQTTAMTEPLFVCEMIWLTVWLVEWRGSLDTRYAQNRAGHGRASMRLLWRIALVLVAAIFTRYDGWVMALLAWVAIGVSLQRRGRLRSRAFWLASAVVVAAPLAWFAYNSGAFGDWLFFERGPYSAKAIEMHTAAPGYPPHPGFHNPWVALLFYMKAAELDAAARAWGNTLLAVCLLGAAWAWRTARGNGIAWALLLALPVPFYAYSVAYSYVPIFLPDWWPHSYYNLRYGLELVPAMALCLGFAAQFLLDAVRHYAPRGVRGRWSTAGVVVCLVLAAGNALAMLHERPVVYEESVKNIDAHRPYEQQIPPVLRSLLAARPGAVILMNTSIDAEIVAETGIPLRQTINEGDLQIYEDALNAPAAHADFILAYEGDAIEAAVRAAVRAHPQELRVLRRFTAPYQPSITLYATRRAGAAGVSNGPGAVIASLKEIP